MVINNNKKTPLCHRQRQLFCLEHKSEGQEGKAAEDLIRKHDFVGFHH